ncbi:MAG: hypothetical protein FH748_14390 [Balneolaceae bacterium]|nr:hypothetical protein [Balneolaceae bacterium]
MQPVTKILNEPNKVLFDKAIKFYFFSRQQDIKKLNSAFQKRLSYSGQVAYSLIITYMREGVLKLEYMDFLNEELKTLLQVDPSHFESLHIKPDEIDEIELNQKVTIKVFDEDANKELKLIYFPDHNKVTLSRV